MHRRLILLLVLVAPLAASDKARAAWAEAKDELERSYFDQLEADKRDRLFEAYGQYDHREAIAPLAEIVSRYGVYMLGVDGELASLNGRLNPYVGRTSIGRRSARDQRKGSGIAEPSARESEAPKFTPVEVSRITALPRPIVVECAPSRRRRCPRPSRSTSTSWGTRDSIETAQPDGEVTRKRGASIASCRFIW